MAEIKDNCGIAAIHIKEKSDTKNKTIPAMYKLLLNLQNRGQLSAGITTYNTSRNQLIDTYKDNGSVNEVFCISNKEKREKLFQKYSGNKAIGHVRYATSGIEDKEYAQPFERHHGRRWKWFSFCFNGNLANYSKLKSDLLEKTDYHITRDTDTEIMMHYVARELRGYKKPDLVKVFSNISKKFDGAYNIAFMNADGDIAIVRDPYGFRPLCYGSNANMFLVASESAALKACGIKNIKSLKPGHMILIKNDKIKIEKYAESKKISHCFFEWIYFSNVSSILDNRSVYLARTNLGHELAKIETQKFDKSYIVVSVPDTSKPIGDAYSFSLKLKSMEGLIRNRYIGRTFIEGQERGNKVTNKFSVLREVLENKKVILVDDSIVRGTTMKKLVDFIKKEGKAKEIHLRIACPPIMAPCFYGIDMSTINELFAPDFIKKNNEILPEGVLKKMASKLGADSLLYLPISLISRSIGIEDNKLCKACLTGKYPTEWGKKLYKEEQNLRSLKSKKKST